MRSDRVLVGYLALVLLAACGSEDEPNGGSGGRGGRGGGAGRGGTAGTLGRGGASGAGGVGGVGGSSGSSGSAGTSGGSSGSGAAGGLGGSAGDDGGSGSGGSAGANGTGSGGTSGSGGSGGTGGSAGSTGSGGSNGRGGSAGTSGSGGSAGTGGSAGSAGTAGNAGTGGSAGTAGTGGSGGTGGSSGTTYYVDPVNGSRTGDGSATNPWRTLQEVAEDGKLGGTVKAGAAVMLRNGYHGDPLITGGSYTPPITIVAQSGHSPHLRRLRANNTAGYVFGNLSISPSYAPTYATVTMVDFQGSASRITLENSEIFSVNDATSWAASDWIDVASSGVQVSGTQITIRNNRVKNVRFGISATGTNAMIDHNTIENFSADGLRGLGNDETFQYNVVKNSYVGDGEGDANHDDGFQSWSVANGTVGTGEVRGMVLRGNTIINFENPAQPHRTTLQGIGCFDGFFVDWVVENNVIITDHWHGISLYGVRNSRVVNNTVIDNAAGQPGPPWIMVNDHKDGRQSDNVVVRNNLATDYDVKGTNITQDHNTTLANDLTTFFVNPGAWDLHLKAGAPAIDTGSATLAPALDRDGVTRPQGNGIDLGAYEFR